jgi:hypothetical protein
MAENADEERSFSPPTGGAESRLRRQRKLHQPDVPPFPWVRIVLLVGFLFVIVYVFEQVRHPRFWASVFPGLTVDTTIPADAASEVQVVSTPEKKPTRQPTAAIPASGIARFNPLGLVQIEECQEIDLENLRATVRDKTGRRPEESLLIQQLLCRAATIPPAELAKQSRRDILFSNLVHDSDRYRGTPIHRRGILRAIVLHEIDKETNSYGLARYYQGWVFTEDQPTNPTVVLFASLPDGISPGDNLSHEVSIDAYYFKLLAFASRDGKTRFAPMLVGYSPTRRTAGSSLGADIYQVMTLIVAFVFFIVGFIVWQTREDRERADQLRIPPTPDATKSVTFDE